MSRNAIQQEQAIQISICKYLAIRYPGVLFTSNPLASIVLRPTQLIAAKTRQMGYESGWPDLFIAAPRGSFHGLFVELKRDGASPFKKTGELRADKHINKQADVLTRLRVAGYAAEFAVGFDAAKRLIDDYLNQGLGTAKAKK